MIDADWIEDTIKKFIDPVESRNNTLKTKETKKPVEDRWWASQETIAFIMISKVCGK